MPYKLVFAARPFCSGFPTIYAPTHVTFPAHFLFFGLILPTIEITQPLLHNPLHPLYYFPLRSKYCSHTDSTYIGWIFCNQTP